MTEVLKKYEKLKPGGGQKNLLRNQPGCYIIEHKQSGMLYVGSTSSLADRNNKNESALRCGKHKNKILQQLYNQNPDIDTYVEPTDTITEAQKFEQLLVDKLKDTNKLCNIATEDVTKTRLNVQLTKEHKEILMSHSLGVKRSESAKQNMSDSQKKFLETPEGKELLRKRTEIVSRKVTIEGIDYPSISEASRTLGISYSTLVRKYKLGD